MKVQGLGRSDEGEVRGCPDVAKREAQWSKDFVEHLRAVHFSLVVLSMGLIIVTFTQRDTATTRALSQLEHIISVALQFDSGWLESTCRSSRDMWRAYSADTTDKNDTYIALHDHVVHPASEAYAYSVSGDCKLVSAAPDTTENKNIAGVRSDGLVFTGIVPAKDYVDRPKTLAEFITLWDLLNADPQVVIPTSLGDNWLSANASLPPQPYEVGTKIVGFGGLEVLSLEIQRNDSSGAKFVLRSHLSGGYIPVQTFKHTGFGGIQQLRELLGRSGSGALMQGTFEDSFPELHDLTEGRESASFDFLRRSLRVEVDRGDQSFEAFGLKLPTPATASWGLVLLIGVQIYFLTHFRELSRRIHPSDDGWEVAWIGVYDGVLARSLFVASGLLLPLVAGVALSVKAFSLIDEPALEAILAAGLLTSMVVALSTGKAFWAIGREKRVMADMA